MNISTELKFRISKRSDKVLILFPRKSLRNLFKREYNPSKDYILVSIHDLKKKLIQDTFSKEGYKELKSMIIPAIRSREQMRKNRNSENGVKNIDKVLGDD